MDVNYCGHCGAAARPQVRFCRQCGAELVVGLEGTPAALSSATEQREDLVSTVVAGAERSENGQPAKTKTESGSLREDVGTYSSPGRWNPRVRDSIKEQPVKRRASGSTKVGQPRASALAQASGLESANAFGSRIRALLLGVAVLVVGVTSLVYYRQSLMSFRVDHPERNLISPEEQSLDLIRLGKQANELGQYGQAIGQFREALALMPQHLPIYLLLAQSYQASGQVDEALRAYWTLLRQDPRNLEARLEIAEVHRARGNWREAFQEYQRIIDINPQSLEAIAVLAVIEAHDERPFGLVRADLPRHRVVTRHKMTSLAPSLPRTGSTAALAPPRVQGSSLAAPPTLLTRAQDAERGDARALAESHKSLGSRYHNVREYLAAIKEFSIAQRLTPDDKDLYYLLGSSYDGLDQDALAHSLYNQCDSGTYVQVARSGAQRTAKAARSEGDKQYNISGADALLPSRTTRHALK